jgi:hypothetical protein
MDGFVKKSDTAPEEAQLEVATVLALEACHVKRVCFDRSRTHLSEDLPKEERWNHSEGKWLLLHVLDQSRQMQSPDKQLGAKPGMPF